MGKEVIIECDGCGTKSGENHYYPANNWVRIIFIDSFETTCNLDAYLNFTWKRKERELVLCRKCLGLPEEKYLPENLYAKGLKKIFKKHRKVTPYEFKLLEEIEKLKIILNGGK